MKKILWLALPNIFGNITIPLLGLVDTALMGNLGKVEYLASVALGSMIFNFIYWTFGFLRMGTVGFASQAFGRNDKSELNLLVQRSSLLSLAIGLGLILASGLLIDLGLGLTKSSEAVENLAATYIKIRILAAPAALFVMSISGWFLGNQNAKYPLYLSLFGNITNIALSYTLVIHFHMDVKGAAIASVIAQYSTMAIAIIIFLKKYKSILIKESLSKLLDFSELKRFLLVNVDIFIRTLAVLLVISFFTIQSANISDIALASNTILFNFFLFFTFMVDGFANSAEALTGELIGKKDKPEFIGTIKKIFIISLIFSILFSLTYLAFGTSIISLLTSNVDVINYASNYLVWVIILPVLSFPAFIFDGIFVGATQSKDLRNAMLFSALVIFMPIFYLSGFEHTLRLWLAFIAFLMARGITLGIFFRLHVLKNFDKFYNSKS